jgi:hypothetical protein
VELYKHNRFNFFKEQIAGRLELYEENVRNNGSPDPFTKNVPG